MQIAQVHRATLIDGQKVDVKVQHEDIKKIILEVWKLLGVWLLRCCIGKQMFQSLWLFCMPVFLQHLKDAKSIVDWIEWAEPQYNFSPMIDEWCKEAPQELDFNHEAGKLKVFCNISVDEILSMTSQNCYFLFFYNQ